MGSNVIRHDNIIPLVMHQGIASRYHIRKCSNFTKNR